MSQQSEPLDAARWRRIANCFADAMERTEDDRAPFVRTTLADDASAVHEVLAMLGSTEDSEALSVEPRLLAGEDDAPLTGQRLGPYVVGHVIGRGGMGEVYLGERNDGAFEQTVAIKVLRKSVYARELVQRFEAERRILARLAHPGIVTILDGGTTPDHRPYLVMPFVDGVPITTWATEHRLGLDERLRLFVRVADVVQYAHSQLVVHRDIKPSNILATADGQIALLDFGIARLLDPSTGDDGVTMASPLRLLTPEHASPEQVRGERAGVASDVYALGVLLYELITSVRPHIRGDRTLSELEREIVEHAPLTPSAAAWQMPWKRRVHGDLDRIVMMALRKEPERRYASAAQLTADVERFLDGLPVRATNDRFSYRVSRFLHRHRAGVGVGVVAAALLITLTIQAVSQSRRAERERDIARRAEASMNNVVAMLTSLFEKANPAITPGGDTVRVAELLTLAEAKVDSLANDPLTQAQLQMVLGEMHMARGRFDIAGGFLSKALTTLEGRPDDNELLLARVTLNLARAKTEYEGHAHALKWFELAISRFERALGANAAETEIARRELHAADTTTLRVSNYMERMVADSALAAITDTIERAQRIHALGVQRYRAGDVVAATPLFEEALRLVDLKFPVDHPTRWVVLSTVAAAKNKAGQFAQAEAIARDLRNSHARRVPVNDVGLAHATEFLAVVLGGRGFLEEAETQQREAIRLWRKSLARTHPSQWNALSVLATIVSARDRKDEAFALLDTAAQLARAGSEEERMLIEEQRVDVLLRTGEFGNALTLLQRVEPMVTTFPERHVHRWSHHWREAVAFTALGQSSEAYLALGQAESGLTAAVPREHPMHAGVVCLRGVLDVRTGKAPPASLEESCRRYASWGISIKAISGWVLGKKIAMTNSAKKARHN